MNKTPTPTLVHSTCVAWQSAAELPVGVLLRGASGSGKSDLALRLIDRGWRLVSDDQCILHREAAGVSVTAPSSLAGKLEVRGLGILPMPNLTRAEIGLVVDLVAPEQVERIPETRRCTLLGFHLRCLSLAPFEGSAEIKLELAAGLGGGPIMPLR